MPGLDTCLLYASIPRMKTLTFPLLAPPPARDLVSGARRGAAGPLLPKPRPRSRRQHQPSDDQVAVGETWLAGPGCDTYSVTDTV